MADAHYLSDKDGKKFYPYAHASATYDNNGNTVEKRLKALDETASSAVQSVKIGTTEYKSGTTVTLPSYPTSLPASDVPSWAKQKTKPTYTASEVGLGNVGNFKAVSTVESQGLTDTEKSNARANIGAQVAGSYASSTHNHDDKYQAKGSYASASHTHDDRYYTETEINTKLNGKANSSHSHGNGDITSLDASKITSGTISIDRLPQGALERLTVVADDTARFKLTSTSVQKGDTVKVTSTGKMYYVVDESNLSTEDGYEVYAAGTAASVPWSGVTGKPSTYTPSSHTHTKSQITDFPTSMPANGGNATTVNGHTVNSDVPSGAKFTDTNTWRPQPDWNATCGDAVIKNKPTIPSVGNGTVTITQNGTSKGTFTMNQSGNTTIALTDTNTDTNTVTNIGTTSSNYSNGNILIQGSGATTVSKSGNTVTISSTNTDTNTWRPLGTTADTACAGNDSRLSNARPASDVSAWAKASSKPSYSKSEVGLGNVDNTADSAKSVKYAISAGSASSASQATGIVDYNATTKTIQIGFSGNGISGNDIKYIAGYTTGDGNSVNAKIKDISKDALKSWLDLGSLAYSSATIPTIPSSLPANGGTATYANYVYATSHQGSWYQNSQWDGTYFQTNYKNGNDVLPMKVGYAGYADSAGSASSVAWSNVSGRPSSMPASDVYSWAKASSKPSYTASEVGAAAANHSHSNYLTGITKSMVTSALGYTPIRVIVQSSEPAISTNDEWLLEY